MCPTLSVYITWCLWGIVNRHIDQYTRPTSRFISRIVYKCNLVLVMVFDCLLVNFWYASICQRHSSSRFRSRSRYRELLLLYVCAQVFRRIAASPDSRATPSQDVDCSVMGSWRVHLLIGSRGRVVWCFTVSQVGGWCMDRSSFLTICLLEPIPEGGVACHRWRWLCVTRPCVIQCHAVMNNINAIKRIEWMTFSIWVGILCTNIIMDAGLRTKLFRTPCLTWFSN